MVVGYTIEGATKLFCAPNMVRCALEMTEVKKVIERIRFSLIESVLSLIHLNVLKGILICFLSIKLNYYN